MKDNDIEITEYPRIEVSKYENDIMYDQYDTEISESMLKENFFVRTRTRNMDRSNEVKIIDKCYQIENKDKLIPQLSISDNIKGLNSFEEKFYKNNLVETIFEDFKIKTFKNDGIGNNIQSKKTWEPHIINFLERNLKKEDILIDVGSNYGWHVINAHKNCKFVYSFEPQMLIYLIQKENIDINKIKNVEIFNLALGNSTEKLNMSTINYEQNGLNIGDLSVGHGGEEIIVQKLDSFDFERVSYIKIDVQGYEKFVILGAQETIKKFKPILIVELENFQLQKFGYDSTELFELIKNYGYYPFLLDYSYPSDHVFVHVTKLEEFRKINNKFISSLDVSNNLNFNLENGVSEKIKQMYNT
jgi:FkbM family methyltransferase